MQSPDAPNCDPGTLTLQGRPFAGKTSLEIIVLELVVVETTYSSF